MSGPTPEFTLLMPCLDEAETLGGCLDAAASAIEVLELDAEVLVADNGSRDGSVAIAESKGARVVAISEKGYGNALRGGIEAARGRYVMFADSDGSVDWADLAGFVEEIRAGADLVMGCRLPSGGGTVLPGAMPWLHRHVGNPGLAWLGWVLFGTPVHDLNCGVRMVRRGRILELGLSTTGMEFASEMLIKATLFGLVIREVPITLSPDGRSRRPHARTFLDGWRHLRFMLLMSPLWLYLIPGALVFVVGLVGLSGGSVGAGMAVLVGFQVASFGLLARTFAVAEGLLPKQPAMERLYPVITLEVGLACGLVLGLAGVATLWAGRPVLGLVAACLGAQVFFTSFLLSMLGLQRRGHAPPGHI